MTMKPQHLQCLAAQGRRSDSGAPFIVLWANGGFDVRHGGLGRLLPDLPEGE